MAFFDRFHEPPNIEDLKANQDVKGLIKALKYKKDSIRFKAIDTLCGILINNKDHEDYKRAIKQLLKIYNNTTEQEHNRINIIKSLVKLNDKELIQQIFRDLDDIKNENVRQATQDILEKLELKTSKHTERSIRVFISSTFRDMQEERDILVKKIFPQIREFCFERGVEFVDIDLRWGVTKEQSENGETLDICLKEIDECHPYFICLLGERYGSILDEIPRISYEYNPWIKKYQDRSMTELEILHALLKEDKDNSRYFFYFRDPEYIKTLPESIQQEFVFENDVKRSKLANLKEIIRQSNFSLKENYPDPQSLGEIVLKDLQEAIEKDFPLKSKLNSLQQERAEHKAFAENLRKEYVFRNNYFEKIDDHVNSNSTKPLIILGEPGSGKSTLIACWTKHFMKKYPYKFLILHFIGGNPLSTDPIHILSRIIDELKTNFNIQKDIPNTVDKLIEEFPMFISIAASQGPFILVLDGLNQLEKEGFDLIWLPDEFPGNVSVILSSTPGYFDEIIEKLHWNTLEIDLLNREEKEQITAKYLKKFGKNLPKNILKNISNREQCSNPLYLKTLMEEIRIFGQYDELEGHICSYLKEKDLDGLFSKILDRLENDYNKMCPDLVNETLSFLWSAKKGLSETEILEILSTPQSPIPKRLWSPFYLDVKRFLINRSGILNFSSDTFRRAVQNRYITSDEVEYKLHKQLYDYFKSQNNVRRIEELPWQLTQTSDWKGLSNILTDANYLKTVYDVGFSDNELEKSFNAAKFKSISTWYEFLSYWELIEENSELSLFNAYKSVLEKPENYNREHIFFVASLFWASGKPKESLQLYKYLRKNCNQHDNNKIEVQMLIAEARILHEIGNLDESIKITKKAKSTCYGHYKEGLGHCYGLLASNYKSTGNFHKALPFLELEEKIWRELDNKSSLANCLEGQAIIYQDMNHVYHQKSDLKKSIKLHKEAERISLMLGDKRQLANCLCNQAMILHETKRLDEAISMLNDAENFSREVNEKKQLAMCLQNKGVVYRDQQKLQESLSAFGESEQLYRNLNIAEGLALNLNRQATVLMMMKDYENSLETLDESKELYEKINNFEGIAACLSNQAAILFILKRDNDGFKKLEEAYHLAKKSGIPGMANKIKKDLKTLHANLNK